MLQGIKTQRKQYTRWLLVSQFSIILFHISSLILNHFFYKIDGNPKYLFFIESIWVFLVTLQEATFLLFIFQINMEILSIFSVLDDRLTARRIRIWSRGASIYYGIIVSYLIVVVAFLHPLNIPFIGQINLLLVVLFGIFVVLADNFQSLYLTSIVYENSTRKQTQSKKEIQNALIPLTRTILIVSLVDLACIAGGVFFLVNYSLLYTTWWIVDGLNVLAALHCSAQTVIFYHLKKMALCGFQQSPKKKLDNKKVIVLEALTSDSSKTGV